MALKIEARDFCKENSLNQTFQTLHSECQVSLNTVDSVEAFVYDINSGRWDSVLPQDSQLKLPRNKLEDLYEQIVMEMIELRELDTARAILRQTQVMGVMKQEQLKEAILIRMSMVVRYCSALLPNVDGLWGNSTKERKRAQIAQAVAAEVTVVPPSRLMASVVKSFSSGKREGGDFVAACVSTKGDWIYCIGEDKKLYCFSYQTGGLEHFMMTWVHEKDVIGVAHHPHRHLIATYSEDCTTKLWKP
ncbi:BnaC06g23460D [Brassica napus]|uniref:BnaC06g23460D protein n=1 Tax=Brassica napus TaxID=3708 RepID=A0A078FDT4_BRANA|nr:BnaC06g23460D [Brassica napus]